MCSRRRLIALSGNDALSGGHVTGLGFAPYEKSITKLLGLAHPRGGRFAPYEKRITELLRVANDKRALKVTKRKAGTQSRAKQKREEMTTVLWKMHANGGGEKKK